MREGTSGERPVAAMLLFPGLTHLDLVGPHAVLAADMDVHLVGTDLDPVTSDMGTGILPTTTMADCPREVDLLMVPGGLGTKDVIADPDLLGEEQARFVQLVLEYDPQPPFDSGVPERAGAEAVERARSMVTEPHAEIVRETARLRDSRVAVRRA